MVIYGYQRKKNLDFFSEMKSATQKTPETKKSFQLVSIWSNNKQKTVNNIAYWPLLAGWRYGILFAKQKNSVLVFLCSIEWALTHQNRFSGSRDPGGTNGRTDEHRQLRSPIWTPTKSQTRSARSLRSLRDWQQKIWALCVVSLRDRS